MSGKLMDEMHRVMRRRHYSIRTERSYSMWVKRYVAFHKMKSRDDLRVRWMILIHILDHLLISWSKISGSSPMEQGCSKRVQGFE